MSIPSTVGQIDHEMPPKPWSTLRLKGKALQTKECCPPSSCTRVRSLATAVSDLRYTLKITQGEDQDDALCTLGKLAEETFR